KRITTAAVKEFKWLEPLPEPEEDADLDVDGPEGDADDKESNAFGVCVTDNADDRMGFAEGIQTELF
ncbi:MAG: hypothetical protein IIY87_01205, partial [Bacteroidales bacterium]|nr:hypothetical protein [Bacteroidales bacterium]